MGLSVVSESLDKNFESIHLIAYWRRGEKPDKVIKTSIRCTAAGGKPLKNRRAENRKILEPLMTLVSKNFITFSGSKRTDWRFANTA